MKIKNNICKYLNYSEKHCPIPQTHQRLQEVHILWHNTMDQYQNPSLFNTYLNTTIQSLRNVSFILQSEKRSIPNFDKWYSYWQEEMRKDVLMRWLHQARNIVVKKGDLEKFSMAKVSLKNWLDYPMFELKAPPLLTTEELTDYIGQHLGPAPAIFGELVLAVERRWVITELPEYEVTDIMAHGFGILHKMVISAHNECNVRYGGHVPDISGRPPCMIALEGTRSVYHNLSKKQTFSVGTVDKPFRPVARKIVYERYGEDTIISLIKGKKDIYAIAEASMEMGKVILKKDKHHNGMAFIYGPDRTVKFFDFNPRDRETKFIMIREIADLIKKTGSIGIIIISEVWLLPMDEYKGGKISELISKSSNKKEALAVHVITKEGPFREYTTPFERDKDGNIVCGETHVEEGGISFYLKPILDVWGRKIDTT